MPRYSVVAIVLHWAIALAIVANFALGGWMHEALEEQGRRALAVNAFQVHKSLGLSVLALSLLRLVWRLLHRPPPLPDHMPAWERLAARATHWTFYALMLAIPLSGWLYVSAQWRNGAALNVPTLWFGLFEVPHLFGLNHASESVRQTVAVIGLEAHEILAWASMCLLVLHVGAALKHHFLDRDHVLASMLPLAAAQPSAPGRQVGLWMGSALILIAAGLIGYALMPSSGAGRQQTTGDIRSAAGGWIVDPAASEITFSGTHAGSPFTGRFTRWQADLQIDREDPTRSTIAATIETGSATDGVKLHDETLPGAEWFDVANHPTATFRSTRVSAAGDGTYRISGELQIKDRSIAVEGLTLEIEDDAIRISGQQVLRRSDANLGMESDPKGEWVSQLIDVGVRVVAENP